jgi:RNA-binding protein
MLTPKLKKQLKQQAHHLHPVIMIGQHGLTPAVTAEAIGALKAHELIKIKINGADRDERAEIRAAICAATEADLIQAIGNMLVIYRAKSDDDLKAAPKVAKKLSKFKENEKAAKFRKAKSKADNIRRPGKTSTVSKSRSPTTGRTRSTDVSGEGRAGRTSTTDRSSAGRTSRAGAASKPSIGRTSRTASATSKPGTGRTSGTTSAPSAGRNSRAGAATSKPSTGRTSRTGTASKPSTGRTSRAGAASKPSTGRTTKKK